MATAADRLQDALIRHQVDIERLKKGTADKFVRLLRKSDAEMVEELRRRLDRFGATGPAAARKVKSLEKLIDAVTKNRRAVWVDLRRQVEKELLDIARMEAAVSAELFETAVGLEEFKVDPIDSETVAAAVGVSVWLGRTTPQHLKALELRERSVIEQSIRQGVFNGISADDITRGLRGSRGFGMADGAIQPVRNGLVSLIHSAINNATTAAREAQFADTGVITGLIWTATLDGRTTEICISRDGHGVPLTDDFPRDIPLLNPQGARPPAHYNCRSFMEAVLRAVGIVKPHRVYVTDTRTEKKRRIDFRAQAKRDAGSNWRRLSERQRRRRIRNTANEWALENIGTVPTKTRYPEFFARQSASFQDGVLGPTRGKLYRQGNLSIDRFVDESGRRLNLEQLRMIYPQAFQRAGL